MKTKYSVLLFMLFFTCPLFSKSIAVMPFNNITKDESKNWIGSGFAETLTTKLVKAKEITVLEREQMSKILEEIKFQKSGLVDEKTAVETGKMYGVEVMVFGSYQVSSDTLRVSARFVDIRTRKIIDTAETTGNISDIFKLQDEIAFALMDSLKIVLAEKEKEEIKVNPTEDLTAYEWFSKGYEAGNLKLYDKAIEYFTKAIDLDSQLTEAYYNRGVAYYKKGLSDDAIEDFTKAIQINPKLAAAYYNRGTAYSEKGLSDEAIEDFTKVIQINPKDADAYHNRGITYANKGLYDEAILDYTKAIKINPKDAIAYDNRGNAYTEKGLSDEAIEDYTKAIQINPKYANAYYNRGLAYGNKSLYDEAIENFTKVIKLDPNYADAYLARGAAYSSKGLHNLCISDWKRAADLGYEEARQSLKKFFNIDY